MAVDLRLGQKAAILVEGKIHDKGEVTHVGPGGVLTETEVWVHSERLNRRVIFRFFPYERIWRYFFQDPSADVGLVYSDRGPTYLIVPQTQSIAA